MRFLCLAGLAATSLLFLACGEAAAPAPSVPVAPAVPSAAIAAAAPRAAGRGLAEVTLLYTSDEHGWLLPVIENGTVTGGAAETLGALKANEGHCVGDAAACPDPRTLLLSGGDNYTGPAISSYFVGEPMADALGRMGYAAMAFGNHELDFGRVAFVANRARVHAPYLAANVHALDPSAKSDEMELPAFQIFERRGAKIGIVGLATETTLTSAMASRFVGVGFEAEEPALGRAIPAAWAAGADAVVLIAHECPEKLVPILDRHPEWNLSFVGAGHCHKLLVTRSGSTPVIAPGWRFERYVRVPLAIDLDKPSAPRARAVIPQLVAVAHAQGDAKEPVDARLAATTAGWQTKLTQALGEELGYTSTGLTKESVAIARWIAGAYRAELKTDVAIVNTGGIRQGLPKGTITKASIWSILPFDNKLVIVKLKGRDLITDIEMPEAGFAGVERVGKGYRLASGKPLDPGATYSVATIDFLYYGGSSFQFLKQDPTPKETGIDWRAPLVTWIRQQKTTPLAPLERRIDPIGGITPEEHH